MSDADGNFVSENFKESCKKLNIEQTLSYPYHHQNNVQVEACFKFLKQMLKKCTGTDADPHIILLQIR